MMNPKFLFSFSVLFFCAIISLSAQLQDKNFDFSDLPSFEDYRPQLPNLSYSDMLYKNKQQSFEELSLKYELNKNKPLDILLEEATVVPDGLLLADGTKYKIRIYEPEIEGLAPMPIVKIGEEPIQAVESYQFKDWSKE